MSKTAGSVYREAAQRIAEGKNQYSCTAIVMCDGSPVSYALMFSPVTDDHVFWLDFGAAANMTSFERYNWRILALCFAAAMSDAGDL